MLELKELYKTFNPGTINAKTALNGLSLTLNDGDFVTVIGGNGAGKSTMLNDTAGTFFVDSGKVIIDGSDVTNLPEHKRAAFIGRVFQDHKPLLDVNIWVEDDMLRIDVTDNGCGVSGMPTSWSRPSANMVSNLIVRRTTSGLSTLITMRADLPCCSTLTSIP